MIANIEIQITILPVSVSTVLDDPHAASLIHAHTEECLIPNAEPQRAIYDAMERAEAIKCFAAYAAYEGPERDVLVPSDAPPLLIGYCSVIMAVMPHDGHKVATIESVFVDSAYRYTGAGDYLLDAARTAARNSGCTLIHYNARRGSRLDKVLSRRAGCDLTHNVYTEWLTDQSRNKLAAAVWPVDEAEGSHV